MKQEEMLSKLLQANSNQRHDFLNHLQVIWGFIKLKKSEKAIDYIEKVTQYIRGLREINNIESEILAAEISAHVIEIGLKENFHLEVPQLWSVEESSLPKMTALFEGFFSLFLEDITSDKLGIELTLLKKKVEIELYSCKEGYNIDWMKVEELIINNGLVFTKENNQISIDF